MGKNFSIKLALSNIKNNRKFYLPYFLASVGIIAMFYIINFLAFNKDVEIMSASMAMIMQLGVIVMGIFSVIFLFYISSFLMKRRKKEIGLYNILGMEKRHIGRILAIENLMISVTAIVSGLLCGILFSKLIHLLVSWVFKAPPPFGISLSPAAMAVTAVLFGCIFLVTLLVNQASIRLAKPVELLYGGNVGEKEPKTRWILAVIGFICVGVGYYIAITTESPLDALILFFIAVVLVIIGTYCLFTAGSIAVLKALKKNKKFYYKPANFTAVSGLIYRMKQNAVGLANICILSTMVLVMISGTVSLYMGIGDVINDRVAGDIGLTATAWDGQTVNMKQVSDIIEDTADVKRLDAYEYLMFTVKKDGDDFVLPESFSANMSDAGVFLVMTEDSYERLKGEKLDLTEKQVAAYTRGGELADHFTVGQMGFDVKKRLDKQKSISNSEALMVDLYYVVVADESILKAMYEQQEKAYGSNAGGVNYQFDIYLENAEEQGEVNEALQGKLIDAEMLGSNTMIRYETRSEVEEEYGGLVGGFLFLGLFLGIIFTFAAALIIYYKQISEGYYDRGKFEIMQKVGMSKTEVKRTIRRQVLLVFFVPLVMAGIHVLAAFKMITRLLLIFSMANVPLFALCTVITFLVFAVIYALVYMVTAREYYKIVG